MARAARCARPSNNQAWSACGCAFSFTNSAMPAITAGTASSANTAEAELPLREQPAERHARDAAEAPDAVHPRDAGRAALRRVEHRGERGHRRLRAVHRRAREKDQRAHEPNAADRLPDHKDERGGQQIAALRTGASAPFAMPQPLTSAGAI